MQAAKIMRRFFYEAPAEFSKPKSVDLKVEKVKNFQRNYLESEKLFSKFLYSYFLERENFQNLKVIEIEIDLKVKIFRFRET